MSVYASSSAGTGIEGEREREGQEVGRLSKRRGTLSDKDVYERRSFAMYGDLRATVCALWVAPSGSSYNFAGMSESIKILAAVLT